MEKLRDSYLLYQYEPMDSVRLVMGTSVEQISRENHIQ